jgi:hypothetical protein
MGASFSARRNKELEMVLIISIGSLPCLLVHSTLVSTHVKTSWYDGLPVISEGGLYLDDSPLKGNACLIGLRFAETIAVHRRPPIAGYIWCLAGPFRTD